jgi:hypothetical protein
MKRTFPLQKGAKMLPKPITKKVGAWGKMEFDAAIRVYGVRWLRVKDGLGGRGDREDWVADLPEVCVSVHDYHWNGDDFGANHGSFRGAIKAEMKSSLQHAIDQERKLLAEACEQARAATLLRKALKEASK